MILENYRDHKVKQLYQMLSRSDFHGNYEDDYVLSILYAMRCIDVCQGRDCFVKERDYVNLAKQIVRIYDESCEKCYENISMETWARALLAYMKEQGRSCSQVHRMSSIDLIHAVDAYIERD